MQTYAGNDNVEGTTMEHIEKVSLATFMEHLKILTEVEKDSLNYSTDSDLKHWSVSASESLNACLFITCDYATSEDLQRFCDLKITLVFRIFEVETTDGVYIL